jgi:hypothetical protein
MKLILQIAAGVVLGWLIITATQSLLAYTALAHFAKILQNTSPPLTAPPASTPHPSLDNPPYHAPTVTQPVTREQLDADEARAKADHDANYGNSTPAPVQMIRKATPADAVAKPPK